MLLLTIEEQQQIKPISDNSSVKFNQIMEETQMIDLQDLLGIRLYNDLILNISDIKYNYLLNGVDWEYDNQVIRMHGLKYVLAFLFYANYTKFGDIHDTYSGHMLHSIDQAEPVTDQRRNALVTRIKQIAFGYWSEVKVFLNNNSINYPYWCYGKEQKKTFKTRMFRLSDLDLDTVSDKHDIGSVSGDLITSDMRVENITVDIIAGATEIQSPFTFPVIPREITIKDSNGFYLGAIPWQINQTTYIITINSMIAYENALITIKGW